MALLPPISLRNSDATIKKVRRLQLARNEAPGYVYLFTRKEEEEGEKGRFCKIGMTRRSPRVRVKEWGGTLRYSVRVSHAYFAERLIHLYLAYCRVYRYRSGRIVRAEDRAVLREGKAEARGKETEWFELAVGAACDAIAEICDVINCTL